MTLSVGACLQAIRLGNRLQAGSYKDIEHQPTKLTLPLQRQWGLLNVAFESSMEFPELGLMNAKERLALIGPSAGEASQGRSAQRPRYAGLIVRGDGTPRHYGIGPSVGPPGRAAAW